jgi:hypothetical protein
MAFAFVAATTTNNTNDVDHSASVSAQSGELLIVVAHQTDGTVGAQTVTDDQGGTYAKVLSGTRGSTNQHTFEIFVRNALCATATHVVTQTRAGTSSGGGISVQRWTGFSVAGAAAFVKANTNLANNAGGSTPTATFASALSTDNATVGVVDSINTQTEPSGWTERTEVTYATPTSTVEIVTRDSGSTASSVAWGASSVGEYGVGMAEFGTTPVAPSGNVSTPQNFLTIAY